MVEEEEDDETFVGGGEVSGRRPRFIEPDAPGGALLNHSLTQMLARWPTSFHRRGPHLASPRLASPQNLTTRSFCHPPPPAAQKESDEGDFEGDDSEEDDDEPEFDDEEESDDEGAGASSSSSSAPKEKKRKVAGISQGTHLLIRTGYADVKADRGLAARAGSWTWSSQTQCPAQAQAFRLTHSDHPLPLSTGTAPRGAKRAAGGGRRGGSRAAGKTAGGGGVESGDGSRARRGPSRRRVRTCG